MKLQSAMEYLMTYSWAILIIAIAMGILAFLGVFDPMTYVSKAAPGSCSVTRPIQGGGAYISGVCGNLVPQFVAQFNGGSSDITTPVSSILTPSSLTVSFWYKPQNSPGFSEQILGEETSSTSNNWWFEEYSWGIVPWMCPTAGGCASVPGGDGGKYALNTWYFVTVTDSGSSFNFYWNGQLMNPGGTAVVGLAQVPVNVIIGWGGGAAPANPRYYFYGDISNVQMYSAALSSNSINALYLEGIGADPIDVQDLIGWWPLNGDTKDYSGNGNNAFPVSISYIGKWWTGYTTP